MDSFKQRLIVDIGNTFYKYLFGGIVLSCKDPKIIFENFKRVNIEIAVCYYSSVNKANLRKLKEAFKDSQFIELKNTVTEEELEKMKLIVDNFSYLGDDMFFDICGGHASSLLVDIGTANKILYIDENGKFQGGAIGVGFYMHNKALSDNTSLLELFDVTLPPDLISLNTKDAINASLLYGEAFKVISYYRYYLKRNPDLKLIVSGGGAKLLMQVFSKLNFDSYIYVDSLVLKGMRRILSLKGEEND